MKSHQKSLKKSSDCKDSSTFLTFRESPGPDGGLFMICGERWCYANFKMGPTISVGSQKVEKYEFDQIQKKKSFGDERIRTRDLPHYSQLLCHWATGSI